MEIVMRKRCELAFYPVNQDKKCYLNPQGRFFQTKRLGEPISYLDGGIESESFFSSDACRHLISQLMWPRLVVIRVNHVLTSMLPLMHLTPDGVLGVFLHDASTILSSLGWILHGLRLLINALELLQLIILDGFIDDTRLQLTGYVRVDAHIHKQGIELTNDLIWVLGAIAPTNVQFTCAFLLVDIVWLSGRAWWEMNRLKGLCEIDAATDHSKLLERLNELAYEREKFILNLVALMSMSAITLLKNGVLPIISQALAVNPYMLLACHLLSLAITMTNHFYGKSLAEQKSCARHEFNKTPVSGFKVHQTFFGKPQSLNEEEVGPPINTMCAA